MRRTISLLLLSTLAALPCAAQSPEEFYAGKQITIICGSEAGSGYDAYARLFAQHLGRFIPGHPTLVVQNMPGAGTLVATNYLANVAPKDGTVIATVNAGMAAEPLFHPETARFDPRRINWLGSPTSEVQLLAVSPKARVQTFAQLFDTELVVAGTGGATTIFPTLLNGVLGTKFKVVKGYAGAASGLLAFERGEVEGMAADTVVALTTTHGDLIADGKGAHHRPLRAASLQRDPEYRRGHGLRQDAGAAGSTHRRAVASGDRPALSHGRGRAVPTASPPCAAPSPPPCTMRCCSPTPPSAISSSIRSVPRRSPLWWPRPIRRRNRRSRRRRRCWAISSSGAGRPVGATAQ